MIAHVDIVDLIWGGGGCLLVWVVGLFSRPRDGVTINNPRLAADPLFVDAVERALSEAVARDKVNREFWDRRRA